VAGIGVLTVWVPILGILVGLGAFALGLGGRLAASRGARGGGVSVAGAVLGSLVLVSCTMWTYWVFAGVPWMHAPHVLFEAETDSHGGTITVAEVASGADWNEFYVARGDCEMPFGGQIDAGASFDCAPGAVVIRHTWSKDTVFETSF
jgi:hypothetical protein